MNSMQQEHEFDLIAAYVLKECRKRNVSGVFVMTQRDSGIIYWTLVLRETPMRFQESGRDANILAVALMKLATVIARGKNTGIDPTILYGEVESKGGRLSADGKFCYAFSGSPLDDELMELAEEYHKSLR